MAVESKTNLTYNRRITYKDDGCPLLLSHISVLQRCVDLVILPVWYCQMTVSQPGRPISILFWAELLHFRRLQPRQSVKYRWGQKFWFLISFQQSHSYFGSPMTSARRQCFHHSLRIRILRKVPKIHEFLRILKLSILKFIKFKLSHSSPQSSSILILLISRLNLQILQLYKRRSSSQATKMKFIKTSIHCLKCSQCCETSKTLQLLVMW